MHFSSLDYFLNIKPIIIALNQVKLLNDVVFSCKPRNEEEKYEDKDDDKNDDQNESKNDNKNENKNDMKYISTGGMRAIVTRGGPLDLAFHHTDSNRLKMTIEMYVSFSEKGIKQTGIKNENMFLMIRTLGCTESSSSSSPKKNFMESPSSLLESFTASGVMWSLSVDENGCLVFNMGNSLKSPSNSMKNFLVDWAASNINVFLYHPIPVSA